jgi:hypothetical protein
VLVMYQLPWALLRVVLESMGRQHAVYQATRLSKNFTLDLENIGKLVTLRVDILGTFLRRTLHQRTSSYAILCIDFQGSLCFMEKSSI